MQNEDQNHTEEYGKQKFELEKRIRAQMERERNSAPSSANTSRHTPDPLADISEESEMDAGES